MEMSLVNAMSREFTLRTYVNEVKKNYDTVLIDCMPSLGMITINIEAGVIPKFAACASQSGCAVVPGAGTVAGQQL